MTDKFGLMDAERGERCANYHPVYTSPCCFHDHDDVVTRCAACGAPLECAVERAPQYVCVIADSDGDDEP